MKDFTYIGRPARVVFGAGKLRELPAEVERLGARKALVLSTPERRAAAEHAGHRALRIARPIPQPAAIRRQCARAAPIRLSLASGVQNAECADRVTFGRLASG